jgi:hypothetical protein
MVPYGHLMIVDQVVDRQHVGTSDLGVIRAVRNSMRSEAKTDPALRDFRKACYRQALATHRANQDEYARIMRGNL